MPTGSRRPPADKWDIALPPIGAGAAETAEWTDSAAARLLGAALEVSPEFWTHTEEVQAGGSAETIAQRYVRRDQGRRVELIALYLETAAAEPNRAVGRSRLWQLRPVAFFVDGVPPPWKPKRALRHDAVDTLTAAAVRVARRGAGRCARVDCAPDHSGRGCGAVLARDAAGDYCAACTGRRPSWPGGEEYARRQDVEGERLLFDRAIAWVLRGDSRAARRRAA